MLYRLPQCTDLHSHSSQFMPSVWKAFGTHYLFFLDHFHVKACITYHCNGSEPFLWTCSGSLTPCRLMRTLEPSLLPSEEGLSSPSGICNDQGLPVGEQDQNAEKSTSCHNKVINWGIRSKCMEEV